MVWGVNVRRWIAKGRMRVVVVGCELLFARHRYRKGRPHRRRLHDYDSAPILHLSAKSPVWGFVGLRNPLRLAPYLLCKIVGRGCCCDGGGVERGERA